MTITKIKRFVYDAIIIAIITSCLAEIAFRLCYPYLPEKIAIIAEEAKHITYTNTRLHTIQNLNIRGIILPPYQQKDLAFVGDSFVFGHYVPQDSSFVSIITQKTPHSVVNLGISGTHTYQYNRMSVVSLNYRPKHLFYCIYAGNDFGWKDMDTTQQLSAQDKDVYLPKDAFLKAQDLTWQLRLNYYWKKLSNYSLLCQVLKLLSNQHHTVQVPIFFTKDLHNHQFSLVSKDHYRKTFNWQDDRVQQKFRVVLNRVRKVDELAKANGMQAHFVLIPFKEMIYGDFVPEKEQVTDSNFQAYLQRLEEAIKKSNIDCYNTTTDLYEKAKQGEKLFFTFDGHFNERGNVVMAELLMKRFNLDKPLK
ncbi:MAG: alginate O-acetyltransferase AlgX-related protein [Thermoflexibacteraceae bacterium]